MKVYLVIYCPYGAPSYDTTIMGAYQKKKSANAKVKELIAEDYPADEVYVSEWKVAA